MCCPTFNHYRSANLEGERSQEWEKLFILCFHCFSHSLHSVSISKPLKVKPNANKIKFVWQNAFQSPPPPPPPPPPPQHTDAHIGMQSWLPKHINFESWQLARWCSKILTYKYIHVYIVVLVFASLCVWHETDYHQQSGGVCTTMSTKC